MNLRIPKDIIRWMDKMRGGLSREAFIITILDSLMKEKKITKKD